jgi:hypothetical protein
MTGNPFPEEKPNIPANIPSLPTVIFPSESSREQENDENPLFQAVSALKGDKSAETVKVVEKVSAILSPYFIVVVGLFVYDSNFFLGTLLIAVGIVSLLKLTWADVNHFFEKVKSLLSSGSDDDEAF